MPTRAETHHVGPRSPTALLFVDLVQDFAGDEAGRIYRELSGILESLKRLRAAARRSGVPVIYVNDHAGRWRSSREELIERACRSRRGEIARALRPTRRDYLVLKPGRSGFHQSPLEALLEALGARHVIIAGCATDVCVLATAVDAIARRLRVSVPADASRTVDLERHQAALDLMATTMGVDVRPIAALRALRPP